MIRTKKKKEGKMASVSFPRRRNELDNAQKEKGKETEADKVVTRRKRLNDMFSN